MDTKPLVSVIVLNHNGKDLLEGCLGSVRQQDYRPLEMIVVDNGSSDGSADFVRQNFPEAGLIENPENRGFAAAANQAIAEARGSFIALLNNDARADGCWIGRALEALAAGARIGSCASKQLQYADPRRIDSAGIGLSRAGSPLNKGRGQPDGGSFNLQKEVFGAHGASAVYRREMLEDVGCFDDDFFAYNEEFDLSLRAQLRGWRCVYAPQAIVYHKGGATRARADQEFLEYYMERNRLCTIAKGYPLAMIAHYAPYLAKYELDIAARVLSGQSWLVRARLDFLKLLPRMLAKRKLIQKRRTITDEQFQRLVDGQGKP